MIFGVDPVDVAAVRERLPRLPEALASAPHWMQGAWLAGSYAADNPTALSDVDVMLLVEPGTPRRFGVPDGWPDLEEACREVLGTKEVYFSEWRQPTSPGEVPALAAGFAGARPLRVSDPGAVARFGAAVFADGRPGPREGARIVWRSRARAILRGGVCYTLARRCLSLGHQAIRILGLPIPAAPSGIPEVLCAVGIVRPKDAAWVVEAFACRLSTVWAAKRDPNDWSRAVDALQPYSERGLDFAWAVLVALERAHLECDPP